MAVPTTITDLSVTAASNSPAGADTVTTNTGPDEYFRALSAILRRMQAQATVVASAATVDLGAVTTGDYFHISGTTTITAFGTVAAGIKRLLVFDGALILTHNATSLILPSGANITTVAGDVFEFVSEGSGNWRCTYNSMASIVTYMSALTSTWAISTTGNATTATVAVNEITATTAGTSTAYTLTPTPAITAYTLGQSFFVRFNAASGAAPTLAISGVATPPNLVKQIGDGTYANIAAGDIPLDHRSRVTLLSATQALVEDLPSLGTGFMHVRDEKASGTAGGSSVAGNQIRTLNTVVTNTITGASLASNEITLPAGTYRITAIAPCFVGSRNRIRLLNVTDTTVAILGIASNAANPEAAHLFGRITITSAKAFNITHYQETASATNGLGVATSDTFVEVYASVMIWKE